MDKKHATLERDLSDDKIRIFVRPGQFPRFQTASIAETNQQPMWLYRAGFSESTAPLLDTKLFGFHL